MPVRGVRRRYLHFVVEGGSPSELEVWEAIRDSVQSIYGAKGISLMDPNLIEYVAEARNGIVRCTHDNERRLRASLARVMAISGKPSAVRVLRSSGTIRTLRAKEGMEKPKKGRK